MKGWDDKEVHQSDLGADHSVGEGSLAPGLGVCLPDRGVEEGDGAEAGVGLATDQVDGGLLLVRGLGLGGRLDRTDDH